MQIYHATVEELRYTTLITVHYTNNTSTATATTATTLHYTTLITLHYITLHYTTLIAPHYNYNYTTLVCMTPELQLHYNYNYSCNCTPLIALHYNYNYSCSTPHYIQQLWVRWPLQLLQPLQKTQLQPPFGPSVDSLCHPCITTTHLSYSVLSLKFPPPPPCAVLLVKGSLGGETSVLRTFRMSRKELVKERARKERVRQGKSSSKKDLVKETDS